MSKQKEDQPEINEEEEVEAADPPAKKGRGRPKGKAPKRGRGRPAAIKEDAPADKEEEEEEVVEKEVEAAEPAAKKGRGRPRTKPAAPPKDPNVPKRGRGRPPKQAKGRGRPPKVVAPVEDAEEDGEEEAAE